MDIVERLRKAQQSKQRESEMSTLHNLKQRIVETISTSERFCRFCGPNHYDIAAEVADKIIAELGIQEAEVSKVYPADRDEADHELYLEKYMRRDLAQFIADNTPLEYTKKISPCKNPFEHNRVRLRALVITRNGDF